ncbi:hypothetical protein Tco_0311545 [Tanacetum coccineum]
MMVKKLEHKVKSRKAKRRVRLVVSEDEADLEDPSKQGKKIAQIDEDEGITLVQMDVETQGRNSDKTRETEEINLSAGNEVFEEGNTEKDVSTASDAVTTSSVILKVSAAGPSTVSTAGPSSSIAGVFEDEMMTIADTLVTIRRTRPRTTSVVINDPEEEPRRTVQVDAELAQILHQEELVKLERVQKERVAQEEASKAAIDEELDDIQAMIEAYEQMAERLHSEEQEKYTIKEKPRMLVEMIAERKNSLLHKEQQKSELKGRSYDEIQKLFDKAYKQVNSFVLMDTKVIKDSRKKDDSSSKPAGGSRKKTLARKRAGEKQSEESAKRQKLEDAAEKEELKTYLKIDPDEDRVVNYEVLATKYPIVDWESQIIGSDLQENDLSCWKITRADGSSKFYKVFSMMLEDIDRQDLVDLHKLVMERSASRTLEGYDLILWGDLKTMFEPSEEDDV